MEENSLSWQESMINQLEKKVEGFPDNKKAFINDDLLKKVICKVPSKIKSEIEFVAFQEKIEGILDDMPKDKGFRLRDISQYTNRVQALKMYLKKKYQLVTKRYYISIFLPIGMCLGMPFGLLVDNLAMGPSFGLIVGLLIGTALDRKAEKEGKVI